METQTMETTLISQERRNIAANVKRLCREASPSLSLFILRHRAGIDKGTLDRILDPQPGRGPRFESVRRVANILHTTVAALREDPPVPDAPGWGPPRSAVTERKQGWFRTILLTVAEWFKGHKR